MLEESHAYKIQEFSQDCMRDQKQHHTFFVASPRPARIRNIFDTVTKNMNERNTSTLAPNQNITVRTQQGIMETR